MPPLAAASTSREALCPALDVLRKRFRQIDGADAYTREVPRAAFTSGLRPSLNGGPFHLVP